MQNYPSYKEKGGNMADMTQSVVETKKKKTISYSKWGYIFLLPFVLTFLVFQLYPLITTFYYSFFEHFKSGLKVIGPNFVGFDNYIKLFSGGEVFKYLGNTMIMWILGFIPQLVISLLFAYWFTNARLNLKHTGIFKSIIYMPNLIMASAFAMLIFALFSDSEMGPINTILSALGFEPVRFLANIWWTRSLVALMNFLMWFGNTTILLMAAMMGIDASLVEAAEIDGASSSNIFWKIIMPLIRPILVYVMITSLIGGLQMFDVPQVLTNGKGDPMHSATTMIMFLNNHLFSKNYGMAGALSVILFIICAVFSLIVYYSFTNKDAMKKKGAKK